jgi:hypothetical protein
MTMHLLSTHRFSTPLSHKPSSRHRRSCHRRSRHGFISLRVSAASSVPLPPLSVDGINLKRLKSVLPGGTWWRLEDEEDEKDERLNVVKKYVGLSVFTALKRMWVLVAEDRWVVFVGFVSLLGAAVIFQFSAKCDLNQAIIWAFGLVIL